MSYYATVRAPDGALHYLTIIQGPAFKLRQNQATDFSFGVAEGDGAEYCVNGRRCTLYRDGVVRASGYITGVDATGEINRVSCITAEAYMRRHNTPAGWEGWGGMDLGRVAMDMTRDFVTRVCNTAEGWNSGVKSSVDTTTIPGRVILAKSGTAYVPQGTISVVMDFGTDVTFSHIRWAEDVGTDVRISAQYRTSGGGGVWTEWSQELSSVTPDSYGVPISGTGSRIEVRFVLRTTDVTSIADDVPTGFSPVLRGAEVLARVPGIVGVGNINVNTGATVTNRAYDRDNFLRIIQGLCEEYGYEFRVRDDPDSGLVLDFDKELGQSMKGVVLRPANTASIQRLSLNGDSLENSLRCFGAGDGPEQIYAEVRDEASIGVYGEMWGQFIDTEADTAAKLVASAQEYLATSAYPKSEFAVRSVSPDAMGNAGLGDTILIADPAREVLVEVRILEESRQLGSSGEEISLGLNTTLANFAEVLARGQLASPGRTTPTMPTVPSTPHIQGGFQTLRVTWQGDGDVYVLEHSADGVNFSRLTRTSATTFTHSGLVVGSTHYYRVCSVNDSMASDFSPAASAVVPDVDAIWEAIATAQETADGKITVFNGEIAPTGASPGDLWIMSGQGNKLSRWNGDSWEDASDTQIAEAIVAAADAQATADGKIQTWCQDNAPIAAVDNPGVGDLWVDTANDNTLFRWNGSDWQSVRDAGITVALDNAVRALTAAGNAQATADGKVEMFYQLDEPTEGMSVGDLWINTSNQNKLFRYSGEAWELAQDQGIIRALTAAAGAQATADGKVRTYIGTGTFPTTEVSIGDLYINTAANNRVWRFSGSTWAEVTKVIGDGEISTGQISSGSISAQTALQLDDSANYEWITTSSLPVDIDGGSFQLTFYLDYPSLVQLHFSANVYLYPTVANYVRHLAGSFQLVIDGVDSQYRQVGVHGGNIGVGLGSYDIDLQGAHGSPSMTYLRFMTAGSHTVKVQAWSSGYDAGGYNAVQIRSRVLSALILKR